MGDGSLSGQCSKGSPGMFGDSAGGSLPVLKPCLDQACQQHQRQQQQQQLVPVFGGSSFRETSRSWLPSACSSSSLSLSCFLLRSGGPGLLDFFIAF